MYYNEPIDRLLLYQKLIQYWSILFDRRNDLDILDNVNFSRDIFPHAIDVGAVLRTLPFEPGYSSPDASAELGPLIMKLEQVKLRQKSSSTLQWEKCGFGVGNGTSNVIYNLLRAIVRRTSNAHIVLALPNYPVYYSQLSTLPGIETTLVRGQERNGFLPTQNEIANSVNANTKAIVLTFPNNPAQCSYEGEGLNELQKIVEFCQTRNIFLIADNIYEDTLYDRDHNAQNIFKLSQKSSSDFLIKAYGPSKDTPFFSGYRFGYWIGDKALQEDYRTLISSSENCLNSLTIILASLFLLFKRLDLENRDLHLSDVADLGHGNFGWSVSLRNDDLFNVILENRWLENYKAAMSTALSIQRTTLNKTLEFLNSSPVFGSTINGNIGNLILTSVKPDYFDGSGHELFNDLATGPKVGILPGDVFAIEKLTDGSTAFRLTLVHKDAESILRSLEKIESYLLRQKRKPKDKVYNVSI